jgi:outer membrane protein assembly factor BamB
MVAVNCADGRPAWTAPNPRRWAMSHSSVVPHIFKGRKMYVYASAGGIAAVNARDGTLLWEYDDWPRIITDIASPIAIAEDTLFVARGYEQGSMILRLRENGDGIGVEMAARLPRKVFGSDQHTPIFFEGRIYGARPPRGELVCLDPEGNPLWSSGTEGRFGIGGFTIADGIIFIMDDKANMTLADAVPGEYRQLSRLKVLDGHDTWGPVTVAGGRLLVRDTRTEKPNSSHLVCLDISAD